MAKKLKPPRPLLFKGRFTSAAHSTHEGCGEAAANDDGAHGLRNGKAASRNETANAASTTTTPCCSAEAAKRLNPSSTITRCSSRRRAAAARSFAYWHGSARPSFSQGSSPHQLRQSHDTDIFSPRFPGQIPADAHAKRFHQFTHLIPFRDAYSGKYAQNPCQSLRCKRLGLMCYPVYTSVLTSTSSWAPYSNPSRNI